AIAGPSPPTSATSPPRRWRRSPSSSPRSSRTPAPEQVQPLGSIIPEALSSGERSFGVRSSPPSGQTPDGGDRRRSNQGAAGGKAALLWRDPHLGPPGGADPSVHDGRRPGRRAAGVETAR